MLPSDIMTAGVRVEGVWWMGRGVLRGEHTGWKGRRDGRWMERENENRKWIQESTNNNKKQ